MVPHARFTELLADIEPSPTTKQNSSSAHSGVRDFLWASDDFQDRMEDDFLAGSYIRDTAIRPQSSPDGIERPDIDIIIVTNFSTSDHPDDVLFELRDALEDEYDVERVNKRSVRIVTSTAEIDVVPVIESNGAYELPDRDLGHWRRTNPPAHTQWSTNQNAAFRQRFKPLVKLVKWWKRQNPSGKRPKGFVLEVLVAQYAPKDEPNYGEAFTKFLENLYTAHGEAATQGIKPWINDPSVAGSDIMSKVTLNQWQLFMEKVRVHAGYARRAQEEDDMVEATRLWCKVFGDRFKATANAAKAATLGGLVTAPTGVIAAGYTFPAANAAPTKPRGFA